MEKKKSTFNYTVLDYEELDLKKRELTDRVKEAQKNAFAPYSNFHVGAGVLLDNGEIVTSTNQESEVYPSGICAERSLLYFVQANYGSRKIVAMAVTASPCGACRQVMVDTEKRNGQAIPIIIIGESSLLFIEQAKDLLPIPFQL